MNKEYDKIISGDVCPAVGYQDVNVCVPVTIKPFGDVGNVKTKCLGKASVLSECDQCPGETCGVCKFIISQKLRVEVPVIFGARAEVGDVAVDCGCAKSADMCEACDINPGQDKLIK